MFKIFIYFLINSLYRGRVFQYFERRQNVYLMSDRIFSIICIESYLILTWVLISIDNHWFFSINTSCFSKFPTKEFSHFGVSSKDYIFKLHSLFRSFNSGDGICNTPFDSTCYLYRKSLAILTIECEFDLIIPWFSIHIIPLIIDRDITIAESPFSER